MPTSDTNWLPSIFLNISSRFGVDLFVLIGAYFMCSKTLDARGIVKRWWKIVYPVIILVGVVYLLYPPYGLQQVFDDSLMMFRGNPVSIDGVWLGHLWFIYPYLILIAISPILTYAMNSMNKDAHRNMIIVLTGLFILVPTINALVSTPFLYIEGGSILTFISLFFVAGYIKKYDVRIEPIKGVLITLGIIAIIFALTLIYTLVLNAPTLGNPNMANTAFFGDSCLPVFVGSIILFLTFRSMDFKNRLISFSGKLTYEAYLIHPVIMNLITLTWPVSYLAPHTGITIQIIITISLVIITSMVYALSRYYVDLGVTRIWMGVKSAVHAKGKRTSVG